MDEPAERKRRLMIKCIDGGTINIPADRISAMEGDTNYIVATNGGEIAGIFDLAAIQTIYLQ